VHDARLVAVMGAYNIGQILIFSTIDFSRYEGLEVVRPDEVL
jgi:hypothetical protein